MEVARENNRLVIRAHTPVDELALLAMAGAMSLNAIEKVARDIAPNQSPRKLRDKLAELYTDLRTAIES